MCIFSYVTLLTYEKAITMKIKVYIKELHLKWGLIRPNRIKIAANIIIKQL